MRLAPLSTLPSRALRRAVREVRTLLSTPAAASRPPSLQRFRAILSERHGIPDLDAERDPMRRMYLDFALTTVSRGEGVAAELAPLVPLRGLRHLDAGCAYGGFLVAFLRAGVREAVGAELQADYLDYARAVLADHGLEARLEHADLLDPSVADRLGRFDLVTANDVIEHVPDPRAALAAFVGYLAPGGWLFLQMPNRLHPPFLRADGHYGLFGLAALPAHLGDVYYRAIRGGEQNVKFRGLGFYVRVLERLGCEVRVLNRPPEELGPALDEIARGFDAAVEAAALPVDGAPEALLENARHRVLRLAATWARAHARWRALPERDPARAALGARLFRTFGDASWRVLARKPGGA